MLGCLAGSVTAQGFVVVPVLIAAHALGSRSRRHHDADNDPEPDTDRDPGNGRGPGNDREPDNDRGPGNGRGLGAGWLVARDVVIAAAATGALGLAVPHGFGWLATVSRQFAAHTPFSVAGGISALLAPVVPGASYDDLAIGGRVTAVTAMVCTVAYLVVTSRARPLQVTAGYALLAVGLLGPVLYPWYLLWGLLCLAPVATGTRRDAVLALSAAGCSRRRGSPTRCATRCRRHGSPRWRSPCSPAAGYCSCARRGQRPPEISRTAGRTSAR